jgi:hypothetical protein
MAIYAKRDDMRSPAAMGLRPGGWQRTLLPPKRCTNDTEWSFSYECALVSKGWKLLFT